MTRPEATEPDAGDVDEVKPETLEEYRAEIRTLLNDLTADAALILAMPEVVRSRMVVLSPEAKQARDARAAADRRAQLQRQKMGEPLGHGPIAAPGNISAIDLADEIARSLHRISIDLVDYDVLPRLPALAGIEKIASTARRIRFYLAAADEDARPAIERTHTALEQLGEHARTIIEGRGQTFRVSGNCPHCDRDTLLVDWDDQVVRCEREPKAKHYAPCICSDPLCECHHRPYAFRHTWYSAISKLGTKPTWAALADRMTITRATTPEKKEAR